MVVAFDDALPYELCPAESTEDASEAAAAAACILISSLSLPRIRSGMRDFAATLERFVALSP